MKISAKITKTTSAAAIFVMFAVPAMAASTLQKGFTAGKALGNAPGDTVLLVRGGNDNGGGGNGPGSGSGDRDGSGSGDRDRDRDGSCQS